MSDAIISHGKHLAHGETSNGTFTVVAQTKEIGWPEREVGAVDITNDDSPKFTKEYLPGLREPGTVSATYVWTPEAYEAIETIFALYDVAATRADAIKYWKITLADGSAAVFQGFITKNDVTPGEGEDVVEGSVEIQCTGALTFTPPASGA